MADYISHINDSIEQQLFREHPELMTYIEYYRNTANDFYVIDEGKETEVSYSSLFLQSDERDYYNKLVYGYIIFNIHYWLINGMAKLTAIKVGSCPSADSKIEINKEKLRNLPKPFVAKVWFDKAVGDGKLSFDIELDNPETMFGDTCFAPLEVGTTRVETLYHHLNNVGSFARWCYDSEYIYLYTLTKEAYNEINPRNNIDFVINKDSEEKQLDLF